MAQMPIEVVEIGAVTQFDPGRALALANSLQSEFVYLRLPEQDALHLQTHAFQDIDTQEFLKTMQAFRNRIAGFHPYLIAFVDGYLRGKEHKNLFGQDRAEKGLALYTTHGVNKEIIPVGRMVSYFLYYMAKATLCFLAPEKHNHTDTRGCVFDGKIKKRDILLSMRAGALCDACRRELLGRTNPISPFQLMALDKLFRASGELLEGNLDDRLLPRAFIGSSSEGLGVAEELQRMLQGNLSTVVWNQGTIFGLGNTTIESLENAVLQYDWGIFVLTQDDIVKSRGILHDVARDNVLFEAGLFMGKLTRRRVLVVQAKGVSVPSDLAGLTTAQYDPTNPDLMAALGPAVEKINSAIGRGPSGGRPE